MTNARFEVGVRDYEDELIVCAQFKDIRDAVDFFNSKSNKEVYLTSAETGELFVQRYRGEIVYNVFNFN